MADETVHPADRFSRRLRGALRRDAKRLLTPGPSTVPMLILGPQVPDDAQVQQVLDVCMRVGEILLSSGESVDEVTATMLRLANAAGLPAVDVDITFTSITMCCHRGNAAQPVTSMRLVRYRTLDLSRLAVTDRIVADLEAGRIDAALLWGPIGSPLVKQGHPDLVATPLLNEQGPPRLVFRITMGVRAGEDEWKRELNSQIRRNQDAIDAILRDAGVPILDDFGKGEKPAAG